MNLKKLWEQWLNNKQKVQECLSASLKINLQQQLHLYSTACSIKFIMTYTPLNKFLLRRNDICLTNLTNVSTIVYIRISIKNYE